MFGKKDLNDIENDFNSYNFKNSIDDSDERNGSFIGKIFKFLMIVVPLLAVAFIGGYGYKNYKNDFMKLFESKQSDNVNMIGKRSTVENHQKESVAKKSSDSQQLYTQEQVRAIVEMMMNHVNEKKAKENVNKLEKNSDTHVNNLVKSLSSVEADSLNNIVDIDKKNVQLTKTTAKAKVDGIDRFNKVIVDKNRVKSDNFASKISNEINNIEKEVKKDNSTYTKSISKEIKTRKSEMRYITVKNGDSLSVIAKRVYGSVLAYDIIVKANPDLIKNPNRIFVGQKLRIPNVNEK